MKQCNGCGKDYYGGGSKYCTTKCRDEFYRKARSPWKYTEKGFGSCEHCGNRFEKVNTSQRFCCGECYNNSLKKVEGEMTCKFCEKSFKSKYEKMYCSRKCSKAYRRATAEKPIITKHCTGCGATFKIEHSNSKYCSDSCRKEFNRRKNSRRISRIEVERECKFCGVRFKTDIENKVYCTSKCQDKSLKLKATKRKRENRLERWKSNPLICLRCGTDFIRDDARQKFCTKECQLKWNNEKKSSKYNSKRELKRYRSMMNNGDYDRSISVKALIDRVGVKCSICGKDTLLSDHYFKNGTFVAGEEYPSVDHIMPISKGGTHTWDNVQLAHRGCNTKKKAELAYETKNGQYRLSV